MDFKNQSVKVDYITLNLKNGKDKTRKIANYLHNNYKFNCYSYEEKVGVEDKKPYLGLVSPSHNFEVVFRFNANPVNRHLISIQFSGRSSSYFYRILKVQKFNWEIFDLNQLSLGRFDINYVRSNQKINESNLLLFYSESIDKFKKRYPNATALTINNTLSLGTRTGDYFLRVYSPDPYSLKFELEIKKYKVKQLTPFLIHSSFFELEQYIIESFFRYLKIALVLDTCYTDWLVFELRNTEKPRNSLVSNYLNKNLITDSKSDKKTFYRIIQFLSFLRDYRFQPKSLNKELYYNFSFPLVDFAKQIGLHPLNSYQRKKLIEFLYKLQYLPPIYQWFSDSEFRGYLIFPVIRIENKASKHTKLVVHISVSSTFYDKQYPFHFPKSFWTYQNSHDFKVKFAIIESMSSQISTKKLINLENLFTKLSYKNIIYTKTNLINQLQQLNNSGLIEDEIYLDQEPNHINELNLETIKDIKCIIFYESI